MLGSVNVFEAARPSRKICARLFGDVCGVVVQNDADLRRFGIVGIEVFEQEDELGASVTSFHPSQDVPVAKVERSDDRKRAQPFVFVVPRDRFVFVGNRGEVVA